jgi:hypothetical protein
MQSLGREANASAEVLESLPFLVKRRDVIHAALLASTTSALGPAFSFVQAILSGLTPAARGEDGSTFLTDPNWKATFLNEHHLMFLSDVIIPATETPGAKEVQVNRYLDLLLSSSAR